MVIEAVFEYEDSQICQSYILPRSGSAFEVETRVFWSEKNRMLKLSVPLAFEGRFLGQVAYGREELPDKGREVVAQKWVAVAENDGHAITCLNAGSYASDYCDGELRLTLLRSPAYSGHPINDRPVVPQDRFLPRIDQGERLFRFRFQGGPADSRLSAVDREALLFDLEQAVYAAKICSYAQGYQLLRAASNEWGWDINYGDVALMWRGGCIIRAQFLGKIKEAFDADPQLANLLLAPHFQQVIADAQPAWRRVVKTAVELGLPIPGISSALNYYDGYRCGRLPANLLQAQRDYFGAHTYERLDKPRGEFFHTNWTGHGGDTASTSYGV